MAKTVLAVDDEPKILEAVSSFLESKGFKVFAAATGRGALDIFERENISLVVLDLMLPDISGEEVCRAIRKNSRIPIIMLTAKVGEYDLLTGLGIGADDYITKPFSLKEMHARVEALLRRSAEYGAVSGSRLVFGGGLEIDFESRAVVKRGREVSLTPNEFAILEVLAKSPNKVFSRERLIDRAFGDEFDGFPRAVDSHIKNIRQKMEDNPKAPEYILTMHGVGYRFGGVRENP